MIILSGKLRQRSKLTIKGEDRLKVVVEHEVPRDNGPADLNLETLFLNPQEEASLPPDGAFVSISVRPYPSGRVVAYSGISVVDGGKGKAA